MGLVALTMSDVNFTFLCQGANNSFLVAIIMCFIRLFRELWGKVYKSGFFLSIIEIFS